VGLGRGAGGPWRGPRRHRSGSRATPPARHRRRWSRPRAPARRRGGDHRPSYGSALPRECSRKSAEMFPWTAMTFSARSSCASSRPAWPRRRSFSANQRVRRPEPPGSTQGLGAALRPQPAPVHQVAAVEALAVRVLIHRPKMLRGRIDAGEMTVWEASFPPSVSDQWRLGVSPELGREGMACSARYARHPVSHRAPVEVASDTVPLGSDR
jgi:hypothetical protein